MAFRSVPRPSSPPGAKASTECPYRARDQTHHAQEPSTPLNAQVECPAHDRPHSLSTHTCGRPRHHERERTTTPLNTFASSRWQPARSEEQTTYRSDMRPSARPETHQNLIYPDKDHDAPTRRRRIHHGYRPLGQRRMLFFTATTLSPGALPLGPGKGKAFALHSFIKPGSGASGPSGSRAEPSPSSVLWRRSGSNRRPPACKAGALPAELRPQKTMVGQGGFEPPTPRLSSVCSNQLSY